MSAVSFFFFVPCDDPGGPSLDSCYFAFVLAVLLAIRYHM